MPLECIMNDEERPVLMIKSPESGRCCSLIIITGFLSSLHRSKAALLLCAFLGFLELATVGLCACSGFFMLGKLEKCCVDSDG